MATGLTTNLRNSGMLENAAAPDNYVSMRTTQFCDRRRSKISFDKVERSRV